ncbi:aldo/keto reductase [Tundrisphaera sp. TA3]|uniref:aldo/keto reductase n=1 Tax=Tundrisphaera sp. TA3 TaxID=3435775 RepID=UPI003EBCFFBE
MHYQELGRTGLRISRLSLGGSAIGQQHGPVSVAEVDETVRLAIDSGMNFVDTSAYYGEGRSEEILGEVLSGGLRDRVLLGTKAGRLARDVFDFSPAGFRRCFEASLKRLRTDSVDILLAHDIEFAGNLERVFTETADTLHRLKAEGKARFVGMSGLPLAVLREAVERCRLDVVMSYCHYNLQDQTLIGDLLPAADAHGVGVLNGSPLGMGLLTDGGPPAWHPADEEIKAACREAARYCRDRGQDISLLGMQFCVAEARIASTLTGTAKRDELERNLAAIERPIDPELLASVQAILAKVRDRSWPSGHDPGN